MSKSKLTEAEKEKSFQNKLQRWRHNGFFGSYRMALAFLTNLQTSPTTRDETRQLAAALLPKLEELGESLKTRRVGT